MTKTNPYVRALWLGSSLLIVLGLNPGCASELDDADATELDETSEALTQAEYDCEQSKRECLIVADCDEPARDACESTFRACREPARSERDRVRALCRADRDACEAAATSDAQLHACHIAEHECKLPVDPPEAICHIEALRCAWDVRNEYPDAGEPRPGHDVEHACHEEERACKESLRLDRADLPVAPRCERPHCGPHGPGPIPPGSDEQLRCERSKRECLITAACDDALSAACETAFHACEEPVRAERERVHALCHAERESCDAVAIDEAGHHACHIAEHRCKLPVDPPDAICHVEALECRWDARIAGMTPPPLMPPAEPSAAERACRESEHACKEAHRVHPEDLPAPPLCGPLPPECLP